MFDELESEYRISILPLILAPHPLIIPNILPDTDFITPAIAMHPPLNGESDVYDSPFGDALAVIVTLKNW
ncbi:hypothetical protein [Nostoc sp.]|uniref:hypothetical protein n=1 Tax=Nostoc sp. TaxID=1180 RepID=UPI002FFA727E